MMTQLVEVVWHDAWNDEENFQSAHGITLTHKPLVVKTLGWLVISDELGVSIACERSTDEGGEKFRGRTFIPKAMIQSITSYKLTKPRDKKPTKSHTLPDLVENPV